MSGQAHSIITEASLNILDEWEREIWFPQKDRLIKEFCFYPDSYFSKSWKPLVLPYVLFVDDVIFHYFPTNQDIDKVLRIPYNLLKGGLVENILLS